MRKTAIVTVMILAVALTVSAGDLDLSPLLTSSELEQLADHVGEAIVMPVGPARPLGITGFDLRVGGLWVSADDNATWWGHSLTGAGSTFGGLNGFTASFRKGLPMGIDVGGQVGTVAGISFFSAELRKAVFDGGLVEPSVGVRGAWSHLDSNGLTLDVTSIDLTVSKRFAFLMPYASAGLRHTKAEATLGAGGPSLETVSKTGITVAAGLHLTLPPLGVRLEVRRGTATAASLTAGITF
jgi:opacity protein-like surface antigen